MCFGIVIILDYVPVLHILYKQNYTIYESILIGSSLINQVLKSRTGREESESESCDMRAPSMVADCEDEGRGHEPRSQATSRIWENKIQISP